jgi:hypothetical protein
VTCDPMHTYIHPGRVRLSTKSSRSPSLNTFSGHARTEPFIIRSFIPSEPRYSVRGNPIKNKYKYESPRTELFLSPPSFSSLPSPSHATVQ